MVFPSLYLPSVGLGNGCTYLAYDLAMVSPNLYLPGVGT